MAGSGRQRRRKRADPGAAEAVQVPWLARQWRCVLINPARAPQMNAVYHDLLIVRHMASPKGWHSCRWGGHGGERERTGQSRSATLAERMAAPEGGVPQGVPKIE